MVTDCIAPVITTKGVATLVTADGMECLTKDLKFAKITVKTFPTEAVPHVAINIHQNAAVKRWDLGRRITPMTPDTLLYTPDGWIEAKKYGRPVKALPRQVLGYWARCVVCQKPYIPIKPWWSACNYKCRSQGYRQKILMFRSLNVETVPQALIEDWVPLHSAKLFDCLAGIEAAGVTSVENSDGIYINGLFLSSISLQSGYNKGIEQS